MVLSGISDVICKLKSKKTNKDHVAELHNNLQPMTPLTLLVLTGETIWRVEDKKSGQNP